MTRQMEGKKEGREGGWRKMAISCRVDGGRVNLNVIVHPVARLDLPQNSGYQSLGPMAAKGDGLGQWQQVTVSCHTARLHDAHS
jgi:hypothetical protein